MNVVIPMAGRGSRFVRAGFDRPKPLIDVLGKPMYAWAVDSLPIHLASRLVFVCLSEHLDRWPLAEDIHARYGRVSIVPISEVTAGQLCTVLAARECLEPAKPLIVHNADTAFRSRIVDSLKLLEHGAAGLIGVFHAEGTHWSFARADDAGHVLETAEKQRISDWATTGLYCFAETSAFLADAEAEIANGLGGNISEFYVAPLFNRMIARGDDIRIDVAHNVWPLGTPEELRSFQAAKNDTASIEQG
jgi:NDP-sugar pyrophosphorylase family protein